MTYIANTIITSLSLALFCMGLIFYVDLHLGYEFISVVIVLEIASFFFSVALSRKAKTVNKNVLALMVFAVLITSPFLLLVINFTSLFSYLLALLCVMIPVILTGIFLLENRNLVAKEYFAASIVIGLFVGMVISYLILESQGIWIVFIFSSMILALAIISRSTIFSLTKIAVFILFSGVLLFLNNEVLNNRLAVWAVNNNPVTKYSFSMLNNHESRSLTIEETSWDKSGRLDIVSTDSDPDKRKYWAIHNASIQTPLLHRKNITVTWLAENYPLMMFPFELKKPSKVLTISAARGADVDVSTHLYKAETTSIYYECASLMVEDICEGQAVNYKLDSALNSHESYDLISLSIFNQVTTPYVGVSASHESIHTFDVFNKLYDSLNKGGLLAINSRDQVLLHKTLSYVWRVLSEGRDTKLINFENNVRVLMLNKYNQKNDAYNYLVIVAKDGFTPKELEILKSFVKTAPVSKVIYDSANNIPPYILFKKLNSLTISAAVSHLTMASSWKFKKLLNLEPSSTTKPDFFYLSKELHPFVAVLSAIFLFLGLYGLLFSHGTIRSVKAVDIQDAPALSILLFQAFLCAVALVLLLYSIVDFTTASLGFSSQYASILMLVALATFAAPHVFTRVNGDILRCIRGLWFYPVILLLCVFTLILMNQNIEILLGVGAQAVAFVLAILVAYCSGQVLHQAALFTGRLYPGVFFWFWSMTSVGAVLGLILAKYIMIGYDLTGIVGTAMAMFVFMAFISWWCLSALRDIAENKADSTKTVDEL